MTVRTMYNEGRLVLFLAVYYSLVWLGHNSCIPLPLMDMWVGPRASIMNKLLWTPCTRLCQHPHSSELVEDVPTLAH